MGKYGKQFKSVVNSSSEFTEEQVDIVCLQSKITKFLNKILVSNNLPKKKNFMQAVNLCYKHNLISESCKNLFEQLNDSACYVKHELVKAIQKMINQC